MNAFDLITFSQDVTAPQHTSAEALLVFWTCSPDHYPVKVVINLPIFFSDLLSTPPPDLPPLRPAFRHPATAFRQRHMVTGQRHPPRKYLVKVYGQRHPSLPPAGYQPIWVYHNVTSQPGMCCARGKPSKPFLLLAPSSSLRPFSFWRSPSHCLARAFTFPLSSHRTSCVGA